MQLRAIITHGPQAAVALRTRDGPELVFRQKVVNAGKVALAGSLQQDQVALARMLAQNRGSALYVGGMEDPCGGHSTRHGAPSRHFGIVAEEDGRVRHLGRMAPNAGHGIARTAGPVFNTRADKPAADTPGLAQHSERRLNRCRTRLQIVAQHDGACRDAHWLKPVAHRVDADNRIANRVKIQPAVECGADRTQRRVEPVRSNKACRHMAALLSVMNVETQPVRPDAAGILRPQIVAGRTAEPPHSQALRDLHAGDACIVPVQPDRAAGTHVFKETPLLQSHGFQAAKRRVMFEEDSRDDSGVRAHDAAHP